MNLAADISPGFSALRLICELEADPFRCSQSLEVRMRSTSYSQALFSKTNEKGTFMEVRPSRIVFDQLAEEEPKSSTIQATVPFLLQIVD